MTGPVLREIRLLGVIALLAACAPGPVAPLPPPAIEDAQALLREVVDAGIARDWERLCANASATCESELQGNEERAPTEPPRVDGVEVYQGTGTGGESSPGGVLFVLCGMDGLGDPYESEVFVFNDGSRLLATAAVYWTGTQVSPGLPPVTTGGDGASRC